MIAVQEVEGAPHPHRDPLPASIVVFGDHRALLLVVVANVNSGLFGADAQNPIPVAIVAELDGAGGDDSASSQLDPDAEPLLPLLFL